MDKLLMKIQDTVMKYADIVSQIADIDVEVVDNELFRVAGTGMFRSKVNMAEKAGVNGNAAISTKLENLSLFIIFISLSDLISLFSPYMYLLKPYLNI